MPLFILFVSLVFASGAAVLFFGLRDGRRARNFQLSVLVFAYVAGCYLAAFLLLCLSPYWTDNGADEFIPLAERWKWATLDFYLVGIILCPLLFRGCKKLSRRHFEAGRKINER